MSAPDPSPPADLSLGLAAAVLPRQIGPFELHGILGRGGMSVVADATMRNGTRVALKLTRAQGDAEKAGITIARTLREARILKKLSHPGIVKLVDAGDLGSDLFYLAMEKIEGVSLLALRRQGPLEIRPLVLLGVRLLDAISHMHESGIIHRDIKPANVLIDSRGRPVIADFGISTSVEATGITRQGDLLGSPGFMAPEIIEGQSATVLSDQFALGRLLFELGATGPAPKLPLGLSIYESIAAALWIDWSRFPKHEPWPSLETIIQRIVAVRPHDRFPSARAAFDALRRFGITQLGAIEDLTPLNETVERLKLPYSTAWSSIDSTDDLWVDEPTDLSWLPRIKSTKALSLEHPGEDWFLPAERINAQAFEEGTRDPEAARDDRTFRMTRPDFGSSEFADPQPAFADLGSFQETTHRHDQALPTQDAEPTATGLPKSSAGLQVPTLEIHREPKLASWEGSKETETDRRLDSGLETSLHSGGPMQVQVDDLRYYPLLESSSGDLFPPTMPSGTASSAAFESPAAGLELPRANLPGRRPSHSAAAPSGTSLGGPVTPSINEPAEPSKERGSSSRGSRESTPNVASEYVAQLERQLSELREKVDEVRRQPLERLRKGRNLIAIGLALVLGVGLGLTFPRQVAETPGLVILPSTGELSRHPPSYVARSQRTPTDSELTDARNMLDGARRYIAHRDLDSAEQTLGLCIEIADLPECHKLLGTLFALIQDPRAWTHLEQFIQAAPGTPDAEAIRKGMKAQ